MPPRTRRYEPPHYPLSATLAPGARTSRTWPAGTRAPRGGAAVGGVALRVGGPCALPAQFAPPGGCAGRDDRLLTRAIGGIPASGWPTRAAAPSGPWRGATAWTAVTGGGRALAGALGASRASGWPTRASAATGPGGDANRGHGIAGGRRDTAGAQAYPYPTEPWGWARGAA